MVSNFNGKNQNGDKIEILQNEMVYKRLINLQPHKNVWLKIEVVKYGKKLNG